MDNKISSYCKKKELSKLDGSVRKACYALTPSDLSEGILEALISLCATSTGNHKQCDKTF